MSSTTEPTKPDWEWSNILDHTLRCVHTLRSIFIIPRLITHGLRRGISESTRANALITRVHLHLRCFSRNPLAVYGALFATIYTFYDVPGYCLLFDYLLTTNDFYRTNFSMVFFLGLYFDDVIKLQEIIISRLHIYPTGCPRAHMRFEDGLHAISFTMDTQFYRWKILIREDGYVDVRSDILPSNFHLANIFPMYADIFDLSSGLLSILGPGVLANYFLAYVFRAGAFGSGFQCTLNADFFILFQNFVLYEEEEEEIYIANSFCQIEFDDYAEIPYTKALEPQIFDTFIYRGDFLTDDQDPPAPPLVGIESNPGPQDPASPRLENLKLKNRKRNRKALEEMKRQSPVLSSKQKKHLTKIALFDPEWEPQFQLPMELSHKMDTDQFEKIEEAAQLLKEIFGSFTQLHGRTTAEKIYTSADVMGAGLKNQFVINEKGISEYARTIGSSVTQGMIEKLTQFFKGTFGDHSGKIYSFLCAVILLKMKKDECSTLAFAATATTMSVLGVLLFTDCIDFSGFIASITSYFKGEEEYEAQAFGEDEILSGLLTCYLGYSLPGIKGFKGISLFVKEFSSMTKTLPDIVRFLGNAINKVLEYGLEFCGKEKYVFYETSNSEVNDWTNSVTKFIADVRKKKLGRDKLCFELANQLQSQGYTLLQKYAGKREAGSAVGAVVRPLQIALGAIMLDIDKAGVWCSTIRQAPVFCMISGESQIGKSFSLRMIVNGVITAIDDPLYNEKLEKDIDSLIYSRQPEHEFWDGYMNQLFCIFDEYNLVPKALVRPDNAAADTVRCGNTFPNSLHMADAERKGNTYFNSAFAICTSNEEHVLSSVVGHVSYPLAVASRFHVECRAVVTKEYAEPSSVDQGNEDFYRLDVSKLPPDGSYCYEAIRYKVYKLVPIHGSPGQYEYSPDVEYLDYFGLVGRLAKLYRKKEREAKKTYENDIEARKKMREWMEETKFEAQAADLLPAQFRSALCSASTDEIIYEIFLAALQREPVENYDNSEEIANLGAGKGSDVHEAIMRIYGDKKIPNSVLTELFRRVPSFVVGFPVYKASVQVGSFMAPYTESLLETCEELYEITKTQFSDWIDMIISTITGLTWAGWAKFLGFVGLIVTLSSFWRWYKKPFEVDGSSPIEMSMEFVAQAHDPGAKQIADSVWKKNYYVMKKGDYHCGYGFFSHGNQFVFPSHYIDVFTSRFKSEEEITFERIESGYSVKVPISAFKKCVRLKGDLAIMIVGNVQLHKDIRHLIVSAKTLIQKQRGECFLFQKEKEVETTWTTFEITTDVKYKSELIMHMIPVAITYHAPGKVGMCGAPVFIVDPSTRSEKFLGFHVAGSKKLPTSIATPLCLILEEEEFKAQADFPLPQTMIEIGEIERSMGSSGISKITKSPLFGAWGGNRKQPAHLRKFTNNQNENIIPFLKAMERFDRPIITYHAESLKAAVGCTVREYVAVMKKNAIVLKKISIEEAIRGNDGVRFHDGLNRSTSPGYPWNMKPRPGYSGKERFFGKGQDFSEGPDYALLMEEVEIARELMKKGIEPEFYFCDSLKDELLSVPKSEAGRTRLFCPAPLVYLILFKEYFQSFFAGMMTTRLQNECAMGINPFSTEWDFLARKHLLPGKKNSGAGDYGKFDITEASQMLREIGFPIVEAFEDREHDVIREVLWRAVWASKHLVGKFIVQWLQSLPSGHPATTPINCIVVGVYFRMAWIKIHDGDISSLREFSLHVTLTVFGDDNLWSITDAYADRFNHSILTNIFAEMGLEYTDELKTGENPPLRNLVENQFLKRGFRYEERYGRYVAPLALETILEMPYWTKKDNYFEVTKTNLENAVRELSLHDEEVFDKWIGVMSQASLDKLHYALPCISKVVLMDECNEKEFHY